MKVEYRRSGGLGGLVAGCRLDTAVMDPGEAAELRDLIGKCKGNPKRASSSAARDVPVHEVRLEGDDGAEKPMIFDDLNLSPAAAALVEFLGRRSAPREP